MIGSLVSRYHLIIRKCIYLMFIFLMTNLIMRKNIYIYIDRLAKLHNILAECDSTCLVVVGDYNANVLKQC